MRKKIIAGNWKMFTTIQSGVRLTTSLMSELAGENLAHKNVIVIPPFTHIHAISQTLAEYPHIGVGAQNCWYEKEGAFTGEVSVPMLVQAGARYVIIGHSERRQYFSEDNALLFKKIKAALEGDLVPVYCCGETLEEREAGKYFEVVKNQIEEGLFNLAAEEFKKVVIAYEPVWAIGTGRTATAGQAQEIHAFIRSLIETRFGDEIAAVIPILYGGSVKPANAKELFSQKDIDGGLVGGASLVAKDFAAIIKAA